MNTTYPSKEIEREDKMIRKRYFETDNECNSLEEFIEKYASEKFKKYLKDEDERAKRLWEEKGEIEE